MSLRTDTDLRSSRFSAPLEPPQRSVGWRLEECVGQTWRVSVLASTASFCCRMALKCKSLTTNSGSKLWRQQNHGFANLLNMNVSGRTGLLSLITSLEEGWTWSGSRSDANHLKQDHTLHYRPRWTLNASLDPPNAAAVWGVSVFDWVHLLWLPAEATGKLCSIMTTFPRMCERHRKTKKVPECDADVD